MGAHAKVLETIEIIDGFVHIRCLVPTHHGGVSLSHDSILEILAITILAVTVIVITIVESLIIIIARWVVSIALLPLTQKRQIRLLQIVYQQLLNVRKYTTTDSIVVGVCLEKNLGGVTGELHTACCLPGTVCVSRLFGSCGRFFRRVSERGILVRRRLI